MPSNPGILGSTRLVSSEDAITPTIDFVALYSNWGKAKTQARKRLSALEQYNYVPDLDFLHLLDDLIAFIRNQSHAAGFWSRYHPEAEMRIAGDYVRAAAQRLLIDVTSSASIALLLNKVQAEGLDEESQRYLEFALREARRSGAHLNETDRKRYKAICDELECLKVEFVSIDEEPHLWVDSKQLDNMPEDFRKRYKADPSTGKVRVSLNPSDYITFVEYCQHDETVEKLYELKENMMPENEGLLKAILELRGEQAKLLGYSTLSRRISELEQRRRTKSELWNP
jgi:Zn-dependent oligopeptidase